MSKRQAVASRIVRSCNWAARRSVRFRGLLRDVLEGLFVSGEMMLPPALRNFDPDELRSREEELNLASERYFAEHADQEWLKGKPFSDTVNFGRHLFDAGVLVHWLRLAPGEVVADIGAGTCWLTHLLNRFGCRTIAIDVSETALAMGRELFETDPYTNRDLEPQFLTYDGRSLPLADSSVDKIIIYDALHHFPDQERLLAEMARVLRSGGIVAMCEPGRRHSEQPESQAEMREHGVLENDIIVEDLEDLALRSGFSRLRLIPLTLSQSVEIPPKALGDFMLGKGFEQYWNRLCVGLVNEHFILVYKGDHMPSQPAASTAPRRNEPVAPAGGLSIKRGERLKLQLRVENTGDTLWLCTIPYQRGWVGLGARLYAARADDDAALVRDWHRSALPVDVKPGQAVDVETELPLIDEPGDYRIVFDMVAEEVMWFSQRDSPTTELRLSVTD